MQKEKFIQLLIKWYKYHKRDLPWRDTKDPYKIWLSEIILQQTRIAQGLPYYLKYTAKFPTLQKFANATEHEVLRIWQGLGYYTRARNMLICAKTLQMDHGGHFPESFEELGKLKGIGDYTAAAIASFAFGKKVAVVDGNVYRVLSRIYGMGEDISSSSGKKKFNLLANHLLPDKSADIYNQAIMEFGALQCVPKNPNCRVCPLSDHCFAFKESSPGAFPVKSQRPKNRKRFFFYFVIRDGEKYYMKMRKPGDIWTGLYDFFLVESGEMKDYAEVAGIVGSEFQVGLTLHHESVVHKHALTHQTIYAKFFHVVFASGNLQKFFESCHLNGFSKKEIEGLPKPNLISNFLNEQLF